MLFIVWASIYIRRTITAKTKEVEAERGVIRDEDGEVIHDPVKERYDLEKRGEWPPAGARGPEGRQAQP